MTGNFMPEPEHPDLPILSLEAVGHLDGLGPKQSAMLQRAMKLQEIEVRRFFEGISVLRQISGRQSRDDLLVVAMMFGRGHPQGLENGS